MNGGSNGMHRVHRLVDPLHVAAAARRDDLHAHERVRRVREMLDDLHRVEPIGSAADPTVSLPPGQPDPARGRDLERPLVPGVRVADHAHPRVGREDPFERAAASSVPSATTTIPAWIE